MKTIFYQQNQLNISSSVLPGFTMVFSQPNPLELKSILDQLIHTKNFKGLIVGDVEEILQDIIKQFKHIKAAGGLVLSNEGHLLMIKRLGKWDLPKGKLETGESKEMGAIREVEEECGINGVAITKSLESSYHIYQLGKDWILKTSYWFLMKYAGNETLIPQEDEDITEAVWVDVKKINLDSLETYPAIAMVLRQSQLLSE